MAVPDRDIGVIYFLIVAAQCQVEVTLWFYFYFGAYKC